jgi:hypothetical protein
VAESRSKPVLRTRTFDAPAAGANIAIASDTAAGWLIRSIAVTFVTGANVGTRSAILAADDGITTWFRSSPGATQAQAITRFYGGFAGSAGASSQGAAIMWGLPTDGLWLPQGHRLITAVENIDPADQWSAVTLSLIEFPTGPGTILWPIPSLYAEESS